MDRSVGGSHCLERESALTGALTRAVVCDGQGVVMFNILTYTPVKYVDYVFPTWAHVIGVMMAMSSIAMIPSYMIYKIAYTKGPMLKVDHCCCFCWWWWWWWW